MTRNFKRVLFIIIPLFIIFFCLYNTQEGFLDTTHKKTIYLVWRNKIDNTTHHGFGDKLRGAIFLYQLCKTENINLKIDATDDICGDFLNNVVSTDYAKNNIKDQPLIIDITDEISGEMSIENIKNRFLSNDTIYVYTNHGPIDMDDDDKTFAKFICEPKPFLNLEINNKLKELPENFGVQHYRFNDSVFKTDVDESDPLFQKYYKILLENYKPTDILFTNSNNFKKYAIENLNIKTVQCNDDLCKIEHIGYSNDFESVKNSFIEFFILSKAKYIKSYTCYGWSSNFVYWPSLVYNIPLTTEIIS